jgi:hypothetical protein
MNIDQKIALLHAIGGLHRFDVRTSDLKSWSAGVRGLVVKDGRVLSSTWGRGDSPEAAVSDLWENVTIRAQHPSYLVVDADSDERKALRWNGSWWAEIDEARVS